MEVHKKPFFLFLGFIISVYATPPEGEYPPVFSQSPVHEIRRQGTVFEKILREKTSLPEQKINQPPAAPSPEEQKNKRKLWFLAATSAILVPVGWYLALNPEHSVIRARHHTRSFGVVEGISLLAPLAGPLCTAGTLCLLWWKFNSLIHYPCKIERERDMVDMRNVAQNNKTELLTAFTKFTRDTDETLTQQRKLAEENVKKEREFTTKRYNSMEAYMQAEITRAHKQREEDRKLIEKQKEIMEKTLDTLQQNASKMHTELEETMKTNKNLKEVVSKAIGMLGKISVEVGELNKNTKKEIKAINSQHKPEEKAGHKRKTSFLHFLHKHHGEPLVRLSENNKLSPRSQAQQQPKKKSEEKIDK